METETLYSAPDKQLKQLVKAILANPNLTLTLSGGLSFAAELAVDEIIYNIVNNK